MTLEGGEFIRRFLLHVLPKGFCKIRYYGIFACRTRETILPLCRQALRKIIYPSRFTGLTWQEALKMVSGIDVNICPNCKKGKMEMYLLLKSRKQAAPAWKSQQPFFEILGNIYCHKYLARENHAWKTQKTREHQHQTTNLRIGYCIYGRKISVLLSSAGLKTHRLNPWYSIGFTSVPQYKQFNSILSETYDTFFLRLGFLGYDSDKILRSYASCLETVFVKETNKTKRQNARNCKRSSIIQLTGYICKLTSRKIFKIADIDTLYILLVQ